MKQEQEATADMQEKKERERLGKSPSGIQHKIIEN